MVASNHRRLGGVSLLLLAASFAFLQQTQAFYDSPSRVSDLLGDHQVRVNQDGYVDYAETRVNIYGERSSVAYRYKPHFTKLKLRVDHSCFSVASLDGKVILQAKNDLFSSRSSSHDCLHSSVTSLTSTEDFTGRTFAFSSQQPSIHDVRSGDILLGVSDMHGKPASFKITSVSQRSVASHPSKAEFEFSVQPVEITDLVSEGEYEFHTDNILTVNDIARPEMKTRGTSDQYVKDLVSMNWNYDSFGSNFAGIGMSKKTIDIWRSQERGGNTIQCTRCFARFTAKATIKWMIEREDWYGTTLTVRFMAHIEMAAQMNVDVTVAFSGWSWSNVGPVRLIRLQSMEGALLSAFSLVGVNVQLGLDYGLDISVGAKWYAGGEIYANVGADAQCKFAFGIYHNYDKPYNQNGCSKQFHNPIIRGEKSIEITPYISLQPYVRISFGDFVKATATVTIEPQLTFYIKASEWVGGGIWIDSIVLRVPVTFDAKLEVDAPYGVYSDSWSFGPYTLLNPEFKLWDHSHSISVRSQNVLPIIETSGKLRTLSTGNQSTPLSSIKVCESCKISNDTIVWNPLTFSADLDTLTTSWQKVDASEDGVGTCTYTSGQVDARTVIFTAPSTGVYEVSIFLVQAAPDSTGNSWNVMARNGPNCCGILTFCSSISVDQLSSISSVFLKQNDTFTMEYTSSVAGSDATIRVKISLSRDPIVYLDGYNGADTNTGFFGQPVKNFEKALGLLASRITPQTSSATVIISPTWSSTYNVPMCPTTDYPKSEGYVIPTQLKNIDLTIKSVVRLRAPSIMFSWGKQASNSGYCNYLIDPFCLKEPDFEQSVWGTAFDTEIKNCLDTANPLGLRPAFTFKNFKSVTLDGLWFENFRNQKNGGALYAENSTLILRNCWFTGNQALQAGSGGALFAKDSKIVIDGTVFMTHKTHNYGGAISTIASDLEITRSVFSGALADKEGGFIYFDSSKGNTISVTSSDFFEASAYSGAGIFINGGRSNARRNSIMSSHFAGLSASTKGGAIVLQNSNLKIALSKFKNTYSIDGSSVVEAYSSSLEMSSNSFNYTGSPQAIFESSDIVEDKSLYSSGGTFCPLSACTTNVLKNGKCDPICNVSLCGFDNGDCLCPIDKCPLSSRGNGVCDLGCATSGCGYDSGDCCNPELCTFESRNNGVCNQHCNNLACNYDDGECVNVSSIGSQRDVPAAAPYISILRSTSSPVLLALEAYANNVIAQHDNRVIGKFLNINPTASAGTAAVLVPKASAIQCSSSTVSMGSTQVQVSNSDSTIQSSGCVGLTSCVNCGACGICRSSGCDTSMMDDACQTKVGAGAKCAPTIASASNNFSVTTCIAAGQQVSPASSADTLNKENKLSTGAIAGISIGALVFVAAVAVMVIAIIKRRASRQRNPREVMASMVEVQVDQAVMNPAAPAQGSADVDLTLVEVPANDHLL